MGRNASLALVILMTIMTISGQASADDFRAKLQKILDEGEGHGLAVTVVRDGEIIARETFGVADYQQNRPVSPDTVFSTASVSKILTGIALLELSQRTLIDLDADINTIAPELGITSPYEGQSITARHLLEHSTGIQEIIPSWYDEATHGFGSVLSLIQQTIGSFPQRFRPGERSIYSNYNYVVLNHLIEKVAGMPFDSYIKQIVFDPLGMERSTFRIQNVPPGWAARGYMGHPPIPVPYVTGIYRVAAGMASSIKDLEKLLLTCMGSGEFRGRRVLSAQIFEQIEQPQTTALARAGVKIGHGAGGVNRVMRSQRMVGHNGIVDGFSASFFYSRASQFGFAIMMNTHPLPKTPSLAGIRNEVIERFAPAPGDHEVDANVHPTDMLTDLRRLSGFYAYSSSRFKNFELWDFFTKSLQVKHENSRVFLRSYPFGEWTPLYALGGTRFSRSEYGPASLAFVQLRDGRLAMSEPPNTFLVQSNQASFAFLSIMIMLALAGFVCAPLVIVVQRMRRANETHSSAALDTALLGPYLIWFGLLTAAYLTKTSQDLLTLNVKTLSIFAASTSLVLLPIAAVILATYDRYTLGKENGIWVRYWLLASHLTLAFALARSELVGIALW